MAWSLRPYVGAAESIEEHEFEVQSQIEGEVEHELNEREASVIDKAEEVVRELVAVLGGNASVSVYGSHAQVPSPGDTLAIYITEVPQGTTAAQPAAEAAAAALASAPPLTTTEALTESNAEGGNPSSVLPEGGSEAPDSSGGVPGIETVATPPTQPTPAQEAPAVDPSQVAPSSGDPSSPSPVSPSAPSPVPSDPSVSPSPEQPAPVPETPVAPVDPAAPVVSDPAAVSSPSPAPVDPSVPETAPEAATPAPAEPVAPPLDPAVPVAPIDAPPSSAPDVVPPVAPDAAPVAPPAAPESAPVVVPAGQTASVEAGPGVSSAPTPEAQGATAVATNGEGKPLYFTSDPANVDPATWIDSGLTEPDGTKLYAYVSDVPGSVPQGDGLGGVWHVYAGVTVPATSPAAG